MIATVVFLAEVPVFEGMLMGDVRLATMRERARQIFVRTQAGFEVVKFVSGERGRA